MLSSTSRTKCVYQFRQEAVSVLNGGQENRYALPGVPYLPGAYIDVSITLYGSAWELPSHVPAISTNYFTKNYCPLSALICKASDIDVQVIFTDF